ncbi:hypothetical protein C3408_22400 [Candidatus Pantoea alvi]|nr:hypothetical protein C3408_22400 [Pantoea alvi]
MKNKLIKRNKKYLTKLLTLANRNDMYLNDAALIGRGASEAKMLGRHMARFETKADFSKCEPFLGGGKFFMAPVISSRGKECGYQMFSRDEIKRIAEGSNEEIRAILEGL